jgi:hypothetical protein
LSFCDDVDVLPNAGDRLEVSGGYDFEPNWLDGRAKVEGIVVKRIPGQNVQPACVVLLDEPLTATGDIRGKRESTKGSYLVAELRYAGQQWESEGTVHVELCGFEPEDRPWAERPVGVWVESHATYRFLA